MDLRIYPSLIQILIFFFFVCQNIGFSPLDPIVIIYIIAKIITFFTNGKSLPNFVHLLSEIHRTTDRDMKNIYILGQNSFERYEYL